jgi:hypothetical protein
MQALGRLLGHKPKVEYQGLDNNIFVDDDATNLTAGIDDMPTLAISNHNNNNRIVYIFQQGHGIFSSFLYKKVENFLD